MKREQTTVKKPKTVDDLAEELGYRNPVTVPIKPGDSVRFPNPLEVVGINAGLVELQHSSGIGETFSVPLALVRKVSDVSPNLN